LRRVGFCHKIEAAPRSTFLLLQPRRHIHLGLSLVALGLIAACSDGGGGSVVTPPPPGDAHYHWMNPASAGNTLSDVWGPSADNLFATGANGIAMRYDGHKWRLTQTPVTKNLNAIWGTDASHLFAVGVDGVILFFNGSSWSKHDSGTDQTLNDVWGTSPSDVYAIGQQRTVVHYNGAVWDTMAVADGIEVLYSMWGSSNHDIYATGLGTKLLHYDGASWGSVPTNATFALNAVWGASATDVFAVGGAGAAVHWDGVAWSNIDVGEEVFPNSLWGTAGNDVYSVGTPSGAGSPAYHWNGLSWTPIDMHTIKGFTRVFGVENEVIAVGQSGMIHRKSGAEFIPDEGGNVTDIEGVWVSPDGLQAFAVGDNGTILHFEHGKWAPMPSGTMHDLRGVGGVCSCSVLAVGESGVILQYNGTTWGDFSPGVPANLNEVWMDKDTGDAFVAGDGGTVMKLENGIWSPLSLGSVTSNLLSVWGSSASNVYVVGNQSAAFKWNGTQFKLVSISPPNYYNFHGVNGSGPDDVYVASEFFTTPPPSPPSARGEQLHQGGFLFHWDGGQWTSVYSDPVNDVLSVWRANDKEGYATGDSYSLLRNAASDQGWVRVFEVKNLPFFVNSVWGSSMKNVFIVGDDGAIVRYSP
jgi:photosystem II stability/assembly factor-like uncharacterized protein